MIYLLLFLGLVLVAFAAWNLSPKQQTSFFDDSLRTELTRPINNELVALYELQESVNTTLAEIEDKNQVFNHLAIRLEKQKETINLRMQQMEKLICRTEAVLNNTQAKTFANDSRFKHDQVYNLFDQGNNITEVAQELGIGKGEVELILGLRK